MGGKGLWLRSLLAGPSNLLATIAKKGEGLVAQIKKRSDVELIEATRENRDHLPQAIAQRILSSLPLPRCFLTQDTSGHPWR
jgi:nucleoside-triphosphatase THEP1